MKTKTAVVVAKHKFRRPQAYNVSVIYKPGHVPFKQDEWFPLSQMTNIRKLDEDHLSFELPEWVLKSKNINPTTLQKLYTPKEKAVIKELSLNLSNTVKKVQSLSATHSLDTNYTKIINECLAVLSKEVDQLYPTSSFKKVRETYNRSVMAFRRMRQKAKPRATSSK